MVVAMQAPQARADEETCGTLFFDDGVDYQDLTYLDIDGKGYGAADDENEGRFRFSDGSLKEKIGITTYEVVLDAGAVRISLSRTTKKKVRKKMVTHVRRKIYRLEGEYVGVFLRKSGAELIEGYRPGIYLMKPSAGDGEFGEVEVFSPVDDEDGIDAGAVEAFYSVFGDTYPCTGGEEE